MHTGRSYLREDTMHKRAWTLILCAILSVSSLVSCALPRENAETSSSGESASAEWLCDRLIEDTGKEYTLSGTTVIGDTDIVVGTAETAAEYGVDVSCLSDDGYVIRRVSPDSDTFIFARTDDGLDRAVRYYANYCDKDTALSVANGEGCRIGRIVISGADISEYVIVCPDGADECMAFAAAELSELLGDACGVYPAIVSEAETDAYAITLARDASEDAVLGDEGFSIVSHERGITITGGRYRGCMYGVYTFLKDYIGYRFYYSSADAPTELGYYNTDHARRFVYEADVIEIASDEINVTELPAIAVRDTYASGGEDFASPALYDNGSNYFTYPSAKYGNYGIVKKACHGLQNYISADYFEERQEGYRYGVNPCMTDEETIDLLISGIFSDLEIKTASGKVPGKDFCDVDISQMDIADFCMCKNCRKVYTETGAVSGVTVKLANTVSEALSSEYPELYVSILAYTTTYKPPKNIAVSDNVMVSYCFYIDNSNTTICSNHSISGADCEQNRKFAKVFESWHELTGNIYVWYYPFEGYYFMNSSPNILEVYDDMKYLTDNNIYGLFSLIGERNTEGEFGLLSYQMIQEMSWDPDITREEFTKKLKEYIYLQYGDGYEDIFEYLTILEEAGNRGGDPASNTWCGFHSCPQAKLDLSFYKEQLDRSYALWERARRLACTAEQERLVDSLMLHILYYDCVVNHTQMWVNGTDGTRAEYKEKLDLLVREMREHKTVMFVEDSTNTRYYVPDEIDINQNPLEWMPSRIGDWSYDYDF